MGKTKVDRSQQAVKISTPDRVQKAREIKEGDFKSAYGGKPPLKHKPTDGGKGGLKGL